MATDLKASQIIHMDQNDTTSPKIAEFQDAQRQSQELESSAKFQPAN
jgi:hypothetical protein